jgi:DNA-directed RNA polymerase specialized sigma24 family protein
LLREELSPERIVGGRQSWDHVTKAIEDLPAGQRAVVMLRASRGGSRRRLANYWASALRTSACCCIVPEAGSARRLKRRWAQR